VIEAEAASGVPAPPVTDIHVFDDRGILFWSYAATAPSGQEVMIEGVDVWTFADGRIVMKDAYRKAFPN
jgi:ketosteroid isomerase-like protein